SNEACATTNAEPFDTYPPENLTADGGDGIVHLNWDPPYAPVPTGVGYDQCFEYCDDSPWDLTIEHVIDNNSGGWLRGEDGAGVPCGTGFNLCGDDQLDGNSALAVWTASGLAVDSRMITPPVDLSDASTAVLDYWTAYIYTEYATMVNEVLITTDAGVSWDTIYSDDPFTTGNSIVERSIDLTPYAGEVVQVAFRFQDDSYGEAWFVDDISITSDAPVSRNLASYPLTVPADRAHFSANDFRLEVQNIRQNNREDVVSYNVYRSLTAGGPYEIIGSTDVSMESYDDSAVENGTTYYYVVSAVYEGDVESDYSNEASATPASAGALPPGGLTADGGDGYVDLAWSEPVPAEEQELSFYDGPLANAFYFYSTFEDGYAHGTKFDMVGSYDILAASAKILSAGDPYWPWPDATHGPVRIIILDDNGGQPNDVLYDEEVTASDGWATVYPNLTGLTGTFYVVISHYEDWSVTGDPEGYGIDGSVDFPDNMVTMQAGSWDTGDVLGYGGDYMFSALVNGVAGVRSLGYADARPDFANIDPNTVTSVHDGSWPAVEGVETHPNYFQDASRTLLGYNIYRDGVMIDSVPASDLTYRDEDVINDIEYCYTVTAEYDDAESGPSNEACATPQVQLPNPPMNLTAEGGDEVVHLNWDVPQDGGGGGQADFFEDFESGDLPAGWDNVDEDGDGENWFSYSFSPHSGSYCMASASWTSTGGALSPDNWLITPALDPTASSELTWWIAAQDPAYAEDHVDVLVSTTGSDPADFSDTVDGYTPSNGDDSWHERTVDLSAYAGQTIYLAFRHTDSYDMFYVKVDDIAVTDLAGGRTFALDFESASDMQQLTTKTATPQLPLRLEGMYSAGELEQIIADYNDQHGYDDVSVNREITGYTLYRSETEGGPYAEIGSTDPATLTYDDGEVVNGTTYYYVATAVYDGATESDYSNEASATPQAFVPEPPTNLVAYGGDGQVNLSWMAPDYSGGGGGGYPECSTDPNMQYEDCTGLCFNDDDCIDSWGYPCTEGLGDGYCDDGTYGYDFNCAEWNYDNGDCGRENQNNGAQKGYVDTSIHRTDREELTGYNVYRSIDPGQPLDEYALIGSADLEAYLDDGLENGTTYYYYVTAIYDDVLESDPSNVAEATPTAPPLVPPANLTAAAGEGAVDLDWSAPPQPEWIGYDDGTNADGIGTGGEADFDVAARFEGADLEDYFGGFLTQVRFFPREAACDYSVRVWIGGSAYNSGVMVIDQPVANVIIDDWNTVILNTPVLIEPGQELWIGYRANTQTGFPAGVDAGPAVVGYGDLIQFGGSWQSISEAYQLDFNWNLEGLVSAGGGRSEMTLTPLAAGKRMPQSGSLRTGDLGAVQTDLSHQNTEGGSRNRELQSFNIYRDGTLIENVPAYILTYHDAPLDNYTEYCYVVTAVYDAGESNPSNEACATPTTGVTFSLSDEEVLGGEDVVVTVSMANEEAVGGFQFDMADTPDYLTLTGIAGTDRVPADWALNVTEQGDGQGRVLGFSFTGTLIDPGTGPILELTFATQAGDPQEVSLCTTDEVVSNASGDGFLVTSGCSSVNLTVLFIDVLVDSISEPVDQGGSVDVPVYVDNPLPFYGMEMHISDIPESVTALDVVPSDRFPDQAMFSFSELDGELTVLWFSLTLTPVDIGSGELFTITYEVEGDAPDGTTALHIENTTVFSDLVGNSMFWNGTDGSLEIGLPDVILSLEQTGDGTFQILMTNNGPVSGFQIDITDVPDYYTFMNAAGTARVPSDWMISGSEYEGSFRLIGFSLTGSQIPAGEGAFLDVEADFLDMDFESELCFTNATISDPDAEAYYTATFCETFINPFEQYVTHFTVEIPETGVNSLVVIQDVIGIDPGDEIGLFDEAAITNSGDCSSQLGELLVGTGVWQGEQLNLTGIGSIDNCDFGGFQLPGYVDGNPIVYKVWKPADQMEYMAVATYTSGTGTWGEMITALTLEVVTSVTQEVTIQAYRNNLFSFNVELDNPSVPDILGDLVLIARNDAGDFYVPSYGIETLNTFEMYEGYSTFPNGADDIVLAVEGTPIDPGSCFEISSFMNDLIAYLPTEPMSAEDAFGDVAESILLVSNDAGEFYVPSLGVNSMPWMYPGEAYNIFLQGAGGLTYCYPSPALARNDNSERIEALNEAGRSLHYEPVETGKAYPIIITELDGMAQPGDEIVAYDKGVVVGATRITDLSQPVVVAAWSSYSSYDVELPGYQAGDEIELRLWSATEQRELRVDADLTNDYYEDGSPLSYGSITVRNMDAVPQAYTLSQNYPNPFNPATTIEFSVVGDSRVTLAIYDITGRLIRTLVNGNLAEGYYNVTWDGRDAANNTVSAGMYIYTLSAGSETISHKMVMMK
ncbi:MAG: T9SS type A sorting domain-containing protein, partial [FCB group bacterium]|nr:T9SS type A sorting domain-containing protein [FCB group bacterium]